jgi:hypothetical protein
MKQGDAGGVTARTAKTLVWPEWADGILIEGLLESETAYERAVELMRKLHPKLKTDAIHKRLRAKSLEDRMIWTTAAFWRRELDFALIGGILGGTPGKLAVIERVHKLWPGIDAEILLDRLEALADHGTPTWAKPEFWTGVLKELLIAGARGGSASERKAIDKILRLHPELRPGVVIAQVRRVRDELRRSEGRRHRKFPWTDDLLDRFRKALEISGVTAAVSLIQSDTGWPRDIILRKAHALSEIPAKPRSWNHWTPSEGRYIIEHANHMSTRAMARELRRSVDSIACKMKRLGLPTGREEGFTISSLATDWHVRRAKIRHWITLNWLNRGKDGRVPERSVRSFCKNHRDQLDWEKLDPHTRSWVLEFCGSDEESEEDGYKVATS